MLIVLDTTETFGNPRLEGPDYVMLRSYVSRHPVSLVVPEIVIDETVNHFREQLSASVAEVGSSMRTLKRLAPHLFEDTEVKCNLDEEVGKYRKSLVTQLKAFPSRCPGYDGIPMTLVVSRALAKRKPFDTRGGAGFRDALIWESLLAHMKGENASDVVIITRNKRDFGEHGGLCSDLADDLELLGLPRTSVRICEGLQRFVVERVKPGLESLDEIERQINEGEYSDLDPSAFFEEWGDSIRDELEKSVERLALDRLTSQCAWNYHRPSLGQLSDTPEQYEIVDVWRVNDSDLAIGIDFDVPGSIHCLQEAITGPYEQPWDEDFDGKVSFKLMMTLIFNELTKEVESFELNDLEVALTGDWGFPERD